jgi:hypothetical protein
MQCFSQTVTFLIRLVPKPTARVDIHDLQISQKTQAEGGYPPLSHLRGTYPPPSPSGRNPGGILILLKSITIDYGTCPSAHGRHHEISQFVLTGWT